MLLMKGDVILKEYYFYNYEDEHGYHEIHSEDCKFLPLPENRTLIGSSSSCSSALMNAQIKYPDKKFDGCFYCCRECHRG